MKVKDIVSLEEKEKNILAQSLLYYLTKYKEHPKEKDINKLIDKLSV